ncbi:MAG: hypothetical protein ACYCXB_09035 [Candidatus Humimicrobiaceae bacterium]
MIKVVDLKKSYGSIKALKGISFEVKQGSIFGFIYLTIIRMKKIDIA